MTRQSENPSSPWQRYLRRVRLGRRALRKKGVCTGCARRRTRGRSYCRPCVKRLNVHTERWRQRHKREGLCPNCSRKRKPGFVSCRRCILRRRRKRQQNVARWRHKGRCLGCGGAREDWRKYCRHCRNYTNRYMLLDRIRVRQLVLEKYGGVCACCSEARSCFLTIDHTRNDGAYERRKLNKNSYVLYRRLLRRKGTSPRYQLLCWNCNEAKRIYGKCPHLKERKAPYLRNAS